VLGEDVLSLSRAALLKLRRRMGMLFQDNALFGSLSVVTTGVKWRTLAWSVARGGETTLMTVQAFFSFVYSPVNGWNL